MSRTNAITTSSTILGVASSAAGDTAKSSLSNSRRIQQRNIDHYQYVNSLGHKQFNHKQNKGKHNHTGTGWPWVYADGLLVTQYTESPEKDHCI